MDLHWEDGLADTLVHYFQQAVAFRGEHPAVEESDGRGVTYTAMARLVALSASWLEAHGVVPGDRVGVQLPKSVDALAVILGVMQLGAAYVPVDVDAPVSRCAFILHDCGVRLVVADQRLVEDLGKELAGLGAEPVILGLEVTGAGVALSRALSQPGAWQDRQLEGRLGPAPDDLAYILYTSGSTGKPKGVMLSHRNATSFIDWCSSEFQPQPTDRFSSHAPFHFDLSILDLYLPIKHGATIVLFSANDGKEPTGLAALIATRAITVWYSTPSVLSMLAQYGKLARHDYRHLRLVFFAGEVFPIKHLSALKAHWPEPVYVNLYGPTETNVCTWHPIPATIPDSQSTPFPIGRVCPHLQARRMATDDREAEPGQEGELWIAGAHVMLGYWNLPARTAEALVPGPDGTRWYRTGDIVVDEGDGVMRFVGRKDRMVKRRGYRIELGEIEAALYRHPDIADAAVVAGTDDLGTTAITAFLVVRGPTAPTTIELKRFCVTAIPGYMIPDRFEVRSSLPKTSTDKTDYQALKGAP